MTRRKIRTSSGGQHVDQSARKARPPRTHSPGVKKGVERGGCRLWCPPYPFPSSRGEGVKQKRNLYPTDPFEVVTTWILGQGGSDFCRGFYRGGFICLFRLRPGGPNERSKPYQRSFTRLGSHRTLPDDLALARKNTIPAES